MASCWPTTPPASSSSSSAEKLHHFVEGIAKLEQTGDVTADTQIAGEERALRRQFAALNRLGHCSAAREDDRRRPVMPTVDPDPAIAQVEVPRGVGIADDPVLEDERETGVDLQRRGPGRELVDPLGASKGSHMGRLGRRLLASAPLSGSFPTDEQPAGLGWRVGARLVDIITFTWLVFFVLVEIDQRLLGGDPWALERRSLEVDSARPVILVLVLVLFYEVLPALVWGASLGKAMFGLRLRMVTRSLPVWLAAVARSLVLYGPVLFLGVYAVVPALVLLVSVAIPANGRGLHDRLVGTLVVTMSGAGAE